MDTEASKLAESTSKQIKQDFDETSEMTTETTSPRKSAFPKKNSQYKGTGRLPCPELGEDWMIEQIVRQQGKSAGRFDTYYYSPTGAKIRSKLKLQESVSKSLDGFDYNLGKFVDAKDKKDGPEIKQKPNKMKSLKIDKLKTIERSPNNITSPKQQRVKVPFTKASESREESKKNKSDSKEQKTLKTKDKSTSAAIRRAIEIVNKENVETLPYNMFKKEAMPHSERFPGVDFEKLVSCAWDFLSAESKKHFEQSSIYGVDNSLIVTNIHSVQPVLFDKPKSAEHPEHCKCPNCTEQKITFVKQKRPIRSPTFVPKRKRCGMCKGCLSSNCGLCSSCRDMKKFGGTGSKKQSCLQRRCEAIHSPNSAGPVSMVSRQSYFSSFTFPQQFSRLPSTEKNIDLWPHFQGNNETTKMQHMPTSKHEFQMMQQNQMALMNFDTIENVGFNNIHGDNVGVLAQEENLGGISFNTTSSGSNNSMEIDANEEGPTVHEQTISHKQQNKRKSRVPVYIKQISEHESPDQI